MIATAKPMVNQERAAEWDWVLIPRIRKTPAMCPTNRIDRELARRARVNPREHDPEKSATFWDQALARCLNAALLSA